MAFRLKMIIFVGLLTLSMQFNAQDTKKAAQTQQEVDNAVTLLKELYPMDLASFKKRIPSLSEDEKATFLAAIVQPGLVKIFTLGKLGDLKNVAERDKFLFLAPIVSKKSGAALYWAYNYNDKKAISILKKSGYSVSDALAPALMDRNENVVNALLEEGVKLTTDAISQLLMGSQLLDQKMYDKTVKILKALLPKVKDINQPTNQGRTLLAYSPNVEIAQMLLDAGAKINKTDNLLARAVQNLIFSKDMAKRKNGSNPFGKNDIGNTMALIELFVKNGANPDLKNQQGKSAMELASEAGLEDVVKILKPQAK